jgi:hypothetical protein
MKKNILFTFLFLCAFVPLTQAQICYTNFEGGAGDLAWAGIDGTLTAPIANPTPNSINSSANCAKYIKSGSLAYSLLLADKGTPFDLSTLNQFKLKILASAPTQVLLKLEGPGQAVEKFANIAVVDQWQEYTFDLSSAAALTGLTKAIIFFDAGVETSADTYYFDDFCAVSLGACAGVTPNPTILDDMECNRNATYGFGWEHFEVIANPDASGANTSAKVAKYTDPSGPGSEWTPLVIDYQNPVDLSVNNQFSVQVWSPKVCKLLLKLEGGLQIKEIFVDITEVNKWVTYTGDFSASNGQGNNKWVLFFNAGVNAEPGDVYYFDNIKLVPIPPIEDFQGSANNLTWLPLNGNATLHGAFSGPTANSTPGGVNTSTQVGCYSKGSSPNSTLQAISATPFNLTVNSQLNIDVLSPSSGTTVVMQLNSISDGSKEATATITTPGVWETLNFDFSAFSGITDFYELRLIFDGGTAAAGQSWCVDNLSQSKVTVNPCIGIAPIINIVDDFECQRNYNVVLGQDQLTVLNNPDITAVNSSLKVGKYQDPANEPWTPLVYQQPSGSFDLSVYNHVQVLIWGPAAVPILFKLEGGTSPAVEVFKDLTTVNGWQKFDIDFSANAGGDYKKLAIFFNAGNSNPVTTYYIDNVKFARGAYNGCIDDHQTPATTINTFKYFANGHLEAEGYQFEIIDNPNPSGINTSSKVGKFVKASDGADFAGMYGDLDAPIDFQGNKTMKAKVHMDHIGNFTIKLEGSLTGAPAIELPVVNTLTNQWEELNFNFSAVPDNAEYQRITLFFDLPIPATGTDVASYFDDISVGSNVCTTVGIFNPTSLEAMVISPNPVSDELKIENINNVVNLDIFNAFGQKVASISTSNDTSVSIDVNRFSAGLYTIVGRNRAGILVGNGKFVKQ